MPDRPMRGTDKNVKSEWIGFSDIILTEEHPAQQFKEMRRAFYAGYLAGITAVSEILLQKGRGTALTWINEKASNEIKLFFDEIEKGTK